MSPAVPSDETLRKSVRVALLHVLIRSHPDSGALAQEAADAVLALPEISVGPKRHQHAGLAGMSVQTVPVHADALPTERAAAKRARSYAESLEGRVLAAVKAAGPHGLTAHEARKVLGLPLERHYSVAPRLSVLKSKGLVIIGETRGHEAAYVAVSE